MLVQSDVDVPVKDLESYLLFNVDGLVLILFRRVVSFEVKSREDHVHVHGDVFRALVG